MSPAFRGAGPALARDASAVILTRGRACGVELFWVRRARHLRFSAGCFAFPGGAVDASDRGVPVEGASGEAAAIVAAARELFEETGVLLARMPAPPDAKRLSELRGALLKGKSSFAEVLAAVAGRLDASDFTPAGRWLTPGFLPIRFDTRLFLCELPPGQEAAVWEGELAAGGWVSADEALGRWSDGQAYLHPPILNALRAFSASKSRAELLERLRHPAHVTDYVCERIELQRGILTFPLATCTLPPATHTGCFLVGTGEMLVVDPGADDPAEQERLLRFVRALEAEGRRPMAIVVTHHHPDHLGGVAALKQALGLPVWAHPQARAHLGAIDRPLADGDVIRLAGELPMEFLIIHTPGHARDHVCLFEPRTRALLCGDMVSSLSSVFIDPPEGDLTDYLDSLERLAALDPAALFPGHGDFVADGRRKLEEQLRHRAWREARLLAVLSEGPATLAAITRAAYDKVAEGLLPFAERSTFACLDKLRRERSVAVEGELYYLTTRGDCDADRRGSC
ncbi:MAG: MBL fold metallo-hydrolase [Myxococcales bacterium]|jgi:ribonuclease/clavin/mitogillin